MAEVRAPVVERPNAPKEGPKALPNKEASRPKDRAAAKVHAITRDVIKSGRNNPREALKDVIQAAEATTAATEVVEAQILAEPVKPTELSPEAENAVMVAAQKNEAAITEEPQFTKDPRRRLEAIAAGRILEGEENTKLDTRPAKVIDLTMSIPIKDKASLSDTVQETDIREIRDVTVRPEEKLISLKARFGHHAMYQEMSRVIFSKSIEELSLQEIAILGIDYGKVRTKQMMDAFSSATFGEEVKFEGLSTMGKADILRKYLYEDADNLTNNFLSANIFEKTFDQLEPQQKTLIANRTRRLAGLAQMNKIILKRSDINRPALTGDNLTAIETTFISSGERFREGVVEGEDIMSFAIFGVPIAEASNQETNFIQSRLVSDLETHMGIFDGNSDHFERMSFADLSAKVHEIREAYFDINSLKGQEGYSLGRAIKRDYEIKPVSMDMGKELIGLQHEGLSVIVDTGNAKVAKRMVELWNEGYSQEEVLLAVDGMIASGEVGKKPISAFLIEQRLKAPNSNEVNVNIANVGDNVMFVVSKGENGESAFVYNGLEDEARNQRLGSSEGPPKYITTATKTLKRGDEILIMPRQTVDLIVKTVGLEWFNEFIKSKGGDDQMNLAELEKIGRQLESQGKAKIPKIKVGTVKHEERSTQGETSSKPVIKERGLKMAEERLEYSQEELSAIQEGLKSYFGKVFEGLPEEHRRILIESAHVYSNLSYRLDHALGSQLGGKAVELLQQMGFSPTAELFVDNYNSVFQGATFINPETGAVDINSVNALNPTGKEFVRKISQKGFNPTRVVWEGGIAQSLKSAIEGEQPGTQKVELPKGFKMDLMEEVGENGDLYLKGTEVRLRQDHKKYECAFLDATRCAIDLDTHQATISFLPSFYADQQDKMMQILGTMGYDTKRVISIGFREDEVVARRGLGENEEIETIYKK